MYTLDRLSKWYLSNCVDDWHEDKGVKIDTLDNPGWSITIDLLSTYVESKAFDNLIVDRSDNDWYRIWRTDVTFEIACGPLNLREAVDIFLDWAEAADQRG